MKLEDQIFKMINPTLTSNNYKIDEIKYEREGNTYFLRVIIDKDGVINIDDCVKACNLINPILDKEDPIKESYILDVCSKEKGVNKNEQ